MTRAWFRRRLDTDPRRWVLLLAALEGLGGYALRSTEKPALLESGVGIAMWLAFGALAPALGVLGVLAHGRLLWWTGKLLGGRARPCEIHAAFAWSELPFVVAVAPMVIAIPFRAAAALMDPVPPSVQLGADLLDAATGPFSLLAAAAAIAGALFYVRFLGEAQGFRAGRAIANHVLAIVVGVAILVGAIAVGAWALPGSIGLVRLLVGIATAVVLALAIEMAVRVGSQRTTRAAAPNP